MGSVIVRLGPGLVLSAVVAFASMGLAALEARWLGHAVIEGLVLAILIGMLVRGLWRFPSTAEPGVRVASKQLLETAVLLLGLTIDLPLLLKAGPALASGIVLLVMLGLGLSYALGRMLGLPHALAVLIACGNSICGNSAIAAVAPVIGADAEQVSASIAFTAVLGIVVVLALPLLIPPFGLSFYQYGVLAGLTVYAVPQVLAAAFQVSVLSGQVGTLVKLVRVLMLGPVVMFFALQQRRGAGSSSKRDDQDSPVSHASSAARRFRITTFVPWFIIGFLILAGLRAAGVVPANIIAFARTVATLLTVVAMAALGLGSDVRSVLRAGRPVAVTVAGSLLMLVTLSLVLIRVLGIH